MIRDSGTSFCGYASLAKSCRPDALGPWDSTPDGSPPLPGIPSRRDSRCLPSAAGRSPSPFAVVKLVGATRFVDVDACSAAAPIRTMARAATPRRQGRLLIPSLPLALGVGGTAARAAPGAILTNLAIQCAIRARQSARERSFLRRLPAQLGSRHELAALGPR